MTEVEHWRYCINESGDRIYEGAVISNSWQPTQQDLERKYGTECVECEDSNYAGIFSVAKSKGLIRTKIDFVNFTCKDCWDELHPEYDYSSANHE